MFSISDGRQSVKRYQECTLLEKLWRRRWYLLIPFNAILLRFMSHKVWDVTTYERYTFSFRYAWAIALGSAQVKMNWYYTSEEVYEHLKGKRLDG